MKALLLSTALAASLITSSAQAEEMFEAGDFMIRARVVGVLPAEDGRVSNGDSVKISNSTVPEFDFTYFFTPNIAAELIAAVTPHDVSTSSGIDAGDAWLLPPTLTVQYHFTQFTGFKPYVGAGVNYTYFFNEDGGSLNSVDYDDSFGPTLQVGFDVPIEDNWYFNVDVKKVWISTTGTFRPSGVRADVDIDPLLVGMGIV